MKKIFLTALLVAVAALSAQAQSFEGARFSLHVGGAFPVSKFASAKENGMGAAFGGMVGARVAFAMPAHGLSLFLNLDAAANGWSAAAKHNVDDGGLQIKTSPVYINVPLMAGVNYMRELRSHTALWAELGMGPNLRAITRFKTDFGPELRDQIRSTNGIWPYTVIEHKAQVGFGLQAGVGMMFNDHVSLGVHYYNLRETRHEQKSYLRTDITNGGYTINDFTSQKVRTQPNNMFVLRLGYHF